MHPLTPRQLSPGGRCRAIAVQFDAPLEDLDFRPAFLVDQDAEFGPQVDHVRLRGADGEAVRFQGARALSLPCRQKARSAAMISKSAGPSRTTTAPP